MTVHTMAQQLGLEVAVREADRPLSGVYCGDLLSVVMGRAPADGAWVTVIGNINAIAVASLTDVSCIVLAEGFSYDEKALEAAHGKVTLLKSALPVYETAVAIGTLL